LNRKRRILVALNYEKLTHLNLRTHQTLDEKWVQDRIAEDPTILGIGDVILKDKERNQPRAGRLDLLLQEIDGNQRFEVEIQLGKTDESHIIRTIEYWDIERKRYPQYDHTAVIIAEEITSRFLNVISLFNGTIPLIAIQMRAVQLGNSVSLMFTTVLDQVQLGLVDEDEEIHEATDRAYWESRGSKATVAMADELLEILKQLDPALELKFNKFYIGLARQGQADNFVIFRPQKNSMRVEPRLKKNEEIEHKIEAAGLDVMDYDNQRSRYRIRLGKGEAKKHTEILHDLFSLAHQEFGGGSS
jgi:predicted transport protein